MFGWITRAVYSAAMEGMRRFFAEVHPEAPPQTVDELKALVAAPAAALPAAKGDDDAGAEPAARKKAR